MRKINQAVTLFYSSTEDPAATERKATVERVCKNVEQARDISIHMKYWKDNIPGGIATSSGQSRIDAAVYNAFDIYFGCLGPNFGSSTVTEFENALSGHIDNNVPTEVLFAFDETPINPFIIPQNFQSVKEFRTSVQSSEKYGRSILYFTFANLDEFSDRLFKDLNEAVRLFQTKIKGGPLPL